MKNYNSLKSHRFKKTVLKFLKWFQQEWLNYLKGITYLKLLKVISNGRYKVTIKCVASFILKQVVE